MYAFRGAPLLLKVSLAPKWLCLLHDKIGMSEQALGWFPLGLVMENESFMLYKFTLVVKEVCFLLSVSSRHDHEDYGQYHHHYDNESSSSNGYEDDPIEGKGRTLSCGGGRERERERERETLDIPHTYF